MAEERGTALDSHWQEQQGDTAKKSRLLQEVVISKKKRNKYVRKGNPAVELVERVIQRKDSFRIEAAGSYKAKVYRKMVMTFGRLDINFQKNEFNRQLSFLEKYMDTIRPDTVPVLTYSLRETLSDRYFQKSPRKTVDYVTARRMRGVDELFDQEGVGANLEAMFAEVDIFQNDIELMLNKFVSPLSSTIATVYYHYFITDTVDVDGTSCIELSFAPVNSRSFGFTGRLYVVNDSTCALRKYTVNVPVDINMNFVNQLLIEQEFMKTEAGLWAPATAHTYASFSVVKRKKARKVFVHQNTLWYDYEVGVGIPDSLSSRGEEICADNAGKFRSRQWVDMRPEPLNPKEAFLDSLSTELRRLPGFRRMEKTAEVFVTGYIPTNKDRRQSGFDVGPVLNMISFNPTEGVRLRVGGMTTANLHNHWFMTGYMAFGCKDLRLKYNFTMLYSFERKERHFNEFPRHALYLSTGYDMEVPGQNFTYMDRDHFLMSYDGEDTLSAAQYVRRHQVRYVREWPIRVSIDTWLRYEEFEVAGGRTYWRVNGDGTTSRVNAFDNFELCLKLRWAPGEKVYNNQSGKDNLIRLAKNAPILQLTHTVGLFDRRCWYNRTDLSVEKRFWLSAFGHIDAALQGGVVWNAVPFPKLYMPPANTALLLTPNTFCLLRPMEFVMDKYVALFATYYLKGWIFNRIPYWNRLNLREVVSFSGVFGGLSARNVPSEHTPGLYVMPDGCAQMGKMPYMELTAGIENIFEILRIDYVRRLTHIQGLSGWEKNGVRLSVRISF